MKFSLALLLIALMAPSITLGVGLAASSGGTMYSNASVTISNSGSINSSTKASASTGGNSVGEGGSSATGDASASASTKIETDGSGGSVDVQVKIEANGQTQEESYIKNLAPGESVSIMISTSSKAGGVKIDGYMKREADTQTAGSASSSIEAEVIITDENLSRVQTGSSLSLRNFFTSLSSGIRGFIHFFFWW